MSDDLMIKKVKEYALVNNVPIMQDEGIEFLTDFIVKNNITNILEVGTAINVKTIKAKKNEITKSHK